MIVTLSKQKNNYILTAKINLKLYEINYNKDIPSLKQYIQSISKTLGLQYIQSKTL